MSRVFLTAALVLLFAGGPTLASAETVTATATAPDPVQIEALMKQIAELQKTIASLKAEQEKLRGQISDAKGEARELRKELRLMTRIKAGDKNAQVELLQEILATDPDIYPEGKVTGYYGPLTAKAVKRLQEKLGLPAVGEVGPMTLEKINEILREGAGESGKIPPGLLRIHGKHLPVHLAPVGDSGIKGMAQIAATGDGKVRVLIELWNRDGKETASTTRPAHIHAGNCATTGPVLYPLSPVVGGRSETILTQASSTADLLSRLPLSINVHRSAEDLAPVACGDIKRPVIVWKGGRDDMEMGMGIREKKMNMEHVGLLVGVKAFEVEAKKFSFSPSEIIVKKGDRVVIKLENKEGFHDWVLDGYNVRTKQINAGEKDVVEFVADKAGTFEYYCSVGEHRAMGMVGKLIVQE